MAGAVRRSFEDPFKKRVVGRLLRFKKPPFVTRYTVWLMGRDVFFSADKARKEIMVEYIDKRRSDIGADRKVQRMILDGRPGWCTIGDFLAAYVLPDLYPEEDSIEDTQDQPEGADPKS